MGLDIRAFSLVKKCDIQNEEAYNIYENCTKLTPNDFIFNQSSGIEDGYYIHGNNTFVFRAGSYSGYSNWRKSLSDMIGYKIEDLWKSMNRESKLNKIMNLDEGKIPFIELLCFSDCEGFIGPKVSNKLYEDFEANRDKAVAFSKEIKNPDWLSLYDDFLKAFQVSRHQGCVQFS